MPEQWDKKVLAVLMQWDYCDKSRGVSGDKRWFYDSIARLAPGAEAFWYDEYAADPAELRRLAFEKAEAVNPDLVFFAPYNDQFDAVTLDKFKARWPTCAWFGDDTWRFGSFSSKLAPHFTHVLSTDLFSAAKYARLGIKPIQTQWAAPEMPSPLPARKPGDKFRFDVSFVGARNSVRAWFTGLLRKRGINVQCFGHGWPGGTLTQEEMTAVFNESRINLNLSNSATRDVRYLASSPRHLASYLLAAKTAEQIKGRNFEIPLAGGFQLTNYVAGLERYLKIGAETAVFASPEECADQIDYYLANAGERCAAAAAGQARAAAEHTYTKRFEGIFSAIWP